MLHPLEDFEVTWYLDSGIGATQQFRAEFALAAEITNLLRDDPNGAA